MMTEIMEKLRTALNEAGVFQHGIVNPMDIEFTQEVRALCEENRCRQYGKSWACPPAVGTVDECRERCQKYENMLVFTGKYDIEDSFDIEGMMDAMKEFKKVAEKLDERIAGLFGDYLLLANEGCGYCEKCTYPDAPCRFPDRAHGSIEGYGIFVNILAQKAGINYINGENTITYFGALLF